MRNHINSVAADSKPLKGVGEGPACYDIWSELWRGSWKEAEPLKFLAAIDAGLRRRWAESTEKAPRLTEEQATRLQGYDCVPRVLVLAAS